MWNQWIGPLSGASRQKSREKRPDSIANTHKTGNFIPVNSGEVTFCIGEARIRGEARSETTVSSPSAVQSG